ncbi:MAG: DUF2974 domain-containing protein [Oscillospiraceae bacterium]|nr:DUF2974 domain-containing protein [Oscillospiraceae bacterium]
MAGILDYLDWRGDIPFSTDPFNEVDGLILSQFGYIDLSPVVSGDFSEQITMSDAASAYPVTDPDSHDMQLLRKMGESRRFGKMRLTGYTDQLDTESVMQFSAVTCILDDGTLFIVYRGTDTSLVGWKEDFTMSYKLHTPGQLLAVQYLDAHFSDITSPLRLGGHSKGGNLAMYAAMFACPAVRRQIMRIYAYDSPGFQDEVADSPAYRRTLHRVASFIPESSLFGLLLTGYVEHTIIKSTAAGGIAQHDPYTWELQRNAFLRASTLSRSGMAVNRTMQKWLSEMDNTQREAFVNTLFDILAAPDAATFGELIANKRTTVNAIRKALSELSGEQAALMKTVLGTLARSGTEVLFSETPLRRLVDHQMHKEPEASDN